jgi:hypothetical protein
VTFAVAIHQPFAQGIKESFQVLTFLAISTENQQKAGACHDQDYTFFFNEILI